MNPVYFERLQHDVLETEKSVRFILGNLTSRYPEMQFKLRSEFRKVGEDFIQFSPKITVSVNMNVAK